MTLPRPPSYIYDGLQRLVGAREVPGTVYKYTFDLAGNRTEACTYNAANQVNGFSYDAVGNLLNDGTTMYTYDALNRLLTTSASSQTRTNSYNGDGVLTQQVANGVTTVYRQDLAAPLSQVLQTTQGANSTSYLYGLDRLAALTGSTRAWYVGDALASARRTLSDAGVASAPLSYDPWGTPEGGAVPSTFGFTGELQDGGAGLVNLRPPWYQPRNGT